jgi:hypothetical protein
MTLHEIQLRFDTLLREAGCKRYTAAKALDDAAKCWRFIHADNVAHGEEVDGPFCNFVVTEDVGIFAFYGNDIEFYVVCGDEWAFRKRFDSLAMTDVNETRAILASDFQKELPDLIIPAALKQAWLITYNKGTDAI